MITIISNFQINSSSFLLNKLIRNIIPKLIFNIYFLHIVIIILFNCYITVITTIGYFIHIIIFNLYYHHID